MSPRRIMIMAAALWLLPFAARAADPLHPSCISSIRVDHTEVLSDSAILFVMRDRGAFQTNLPQPCIGLKNDNRGFTYEPTDNNDELCANLMTIRLNTFKSVCMLGPWVKVK